MPAVKAEQIEVRSFSGSDQDPASASSRQNNDHHQRQYVLDRNTRLRENSLPYRQPDPPMQYLPAAHPAILAQAIGQATHETLLGMRNAVYLCALQEITEVRSVAATYQRQAIQFHEELSDIRYAYAQLLSRTKASGCQQEDRMEDNISSVEALALSSSTSTSPLVQPVSTLNATASEPTPMTAISPVQPVSASTVTVPEPARAPAPHTTHTNPGLQPTVTETGFGLTSQMMAPGDSRHSPTTIVAQTNPRPSAGQIFAFSYSRPVLGPSLQELYGPVNLAGGFRIITHVGSWDTTHCLRPSDLPFEVFWFKNDWFGKGYSNGTFVTDRNGNHLKHLMKGIRKTARNIWTELGKRPGSCAATTFNKNGLAFVADYICTIEEIYPCLKLCSGHWKAKQIGIGAYSHWYKNHSRFLDGTIAA